jgi:hypothetical protein
MNDDPLFRLLRIRYDQINQLHKRIELLEYALRSIAETPIGAEIPDRTTIWGLAVYMRETATDALKETKDEERSTQL